MFNSNYRLVKIKNDLAQYDFKIKYKKGSLNTNADALSRMYVVLCWIIPLPITNSPFNGNVYLNRSHQLVASRSLDVFLFFLSSHLVSNQSHKNKVVSIQNTIALVSHSTLCSDEVEKEKLMKECHDSTLAGHRSPETTLKKFNDLGYSWPSISKDVHEEIRKCESCQKNKLYRKTRLEMQMTDTPSKPFEKVAMDIVGPLHKTFKGYDYILTIQDNFSKYLVAIPLRDQTAESVADAVAEH